jgi:hypothetical protein
MTLTGAELLTGFSKFIDDYWLGTTTGAGLADGTTLVDTTLGRFGNGELTGRYVRPTGATNQFAIRRVTSNVASSGTITVLPAFTAQTASTQTYEVHKVDPSVKFEVLDQARFDVADNVFQLIHSDTLTGDGHTRTFPTPSSIVSGPINVYLEHPLSCENQWNFITDPLGNSTTNWTASSVTASTLERADNDMLVPKYGDVATKLVVAATTAGTYTQVVGDMANGITAALAADRQMTFAAWVYCTETSKIRLNLIDNASTTNGSYHGGSGWELLTVSKTIVGNNSATLSAQFGVASTDNAATVYWERAWLYFGDTERVTEIFPEERALEVVRRDNTTQNFTLMSTPPRGYQLRVVGKGILSALGTTAATQVTNTMEVDTQTAELVYAKAAEILFAREGISAENVPQVVQRIQFVRARVPKLIQNWAQDVPSSTVVGPYSR